MHCGVSVRELYGALTFHSITLQAPHITISFPVLPTFNICLWNWRRKRPGEEARVSNVCLCSLTNVAWYVLILHLLVAWRVARMRIQHLSMNKYILLVSCDYKFKYWHLGTVFSSVNICWAQQLWGQASFAVVYTVSPFPEHCVYWTFGMQFHKLFSSCMLLNKLGLYDRVTQASLVRVLTSYNHSVHLSMADPPLMAESRSTLLNNQSLSC